MEQALTAIDQREVFQVYARGTGWQARNDRISARLFLDHVPDTDPILPGASVCFRGLVTIEDGEFVFRPDKVWSAPFGT